MKRFITIMLVFALCFSICCYASAEVCHTPDDVETVRVYWVEYASWDPIKKHTYTSKYNVICIYCHEKVDGPFNDENLNNSGVESCTILTKTPTHGAGHNTTSHWDIANRIEYCKYCEYEKTTETNIQINTESHKGLSSTWTDGGHSGVYHLYYNTCTKPACNNYCFLWRKISCPDPNNHVAPNAYTPPLVTE